MFLEKFNLPTKCGECGYHAPEERIVLCKKSIYLCKGCFNNLTEMITKLVRDKQI